VGETHADDADDAVYCNDFAESIEYLPLEGPAELFSFVSFSLSLAVPVRLEILRGYVSKEKKFLFMRYIHTRVPAIKR
jgi:hypothetical protein